MELFTVDGLPLIKAGDDIAELICERAVLEDMDVVAIASTIVARAEGAVVCQADLVPGEHAKKIAAASGKDAALIQAVLNNSAEVLMEDPILLVENLNGHVSIHAGIDDSNVEEGYLARLPDDPDASARGIASKIKELTGRKVSVILTDTNGRAFKKGQTGVAVGLSGLEVILDWRGKRDLFGRELKIAEEAVADELASAANLLMGEGGDGQPVVIIRGLDLYTDRQCSVKQMYRNRDEDVIRKGLVCLKQSGER